ncbi:zinc finger and BTB domain-containing protein 41 isoform X2 [Gouania willdenowi]|nr:zinc finger and BTB domain-containing protein 41 isoform X2 [Gouania willdenowi]
MKKKSPNVLRPERGRRFPSCSSDGNKETSAALGFRSPAQASNSHVRHLTMPHHSNNLLKFLNEDRTRQKFCDVSVSVGGKVYKAHKVVLAHASSYFHAELSKNPAETTHVTLNHVEDSVFQHLLAFLYTAECAVAESYLPALTEAARFLDMIDILKLLCEEEAVHPVGIGQGAAKKTQYSNVEVAVSGPRGAYSDTQSPGELMCSLCTLSFNTDHHLQDHLAECHDIIRTVVSADVKTNQKSASARRSVRSRRTPKKYKKDEAESSISTSKDKQVSVSHRHKGETSVETRGELAVESQNPKSNVKESSKPSHQEAVGNEDEGQEEEEETEGNPCPDTLINVDDTHSSKVEKSEPQSARGMEPVVSAPGTSTQSRVYPEGLAPVIIQTSSKKMLKCPKCDKTFDRAGKYESHTRVHTGEKPFQCDICLQRYSTKSNLTVHKKKHASNAPIQKKEHKCPFCNKLHASKKTLIKHIRRFHPDNIQEFLSKNKRKSEGWKCSICLKTFTRRPHLQEHMILHTQDRPFKCNFCEEYFKSRFARLKHQEKYHLGPFPCEICGRQFNDSGNRKRHIECTHGGKRKWTCFVCGKSVRERTSLREHMRIHSGEKPHLCSICGQSFRHGSSYRLHLRVHHDDKRYECDECGKTFIRHDHLTKHQKIHSGEKAHQCEECGKCFRRQDHLTVHYKSVHLGEKVWQKYKTAIHQCEVCKKEFKGKSSLEMHFRTHSGEKPYRCPECHQTFRIKKTLTKHMVIHSDARPFNCPHCSSTFKRKDKLKYHVDHVHSARFMETQPIAALNEEKIVSIPFVEASESYQDEEKSSIQSSSSPVDASVPVTLVPVQIAGGAPTDLTTHRTQTHGVVSMQAQGQQQTAGYQAAADLNFLDKYNNVHPMRSEQTLDPREQSYLGTLLGLDSASSVQNISTADHAH